MANETSTELVSTASTSITPMGLIEMATSRGASVEQMQQLFDLQLRWEANEAKKAFNAAMATFKRTPPAIAKNRRVQFGTTTYDHATLDNVVNAVTPALSAVHIRHRWEARQPDAGWVEVTCVLSHDLGHSESTTLRAQVDSSGSKNAIQAVGSTVTYLQRYTLLAATGLAVVGADSDGATEGPRMPDPEYVAHRDAIEGARTLTELQRIFGLAYGAAQKVGDKDAMKDFIGHKDKRKGELR